MNNLEIDTFQNGNNFSTIQNGTKFSTIQNGTKFQETTRTSTDVHRLFDVANIPHI